MPLENDWIISQKVRARQTEMGIEIIIDGITTQAKYYKPLVYEFFRKSWPSEGYGEGHSKGYGEGPQSGDFAVEIRMEHIGDPPWMDLDNLAKALLDAIKGFVFHDDSQVARLLVERFEGDKERISIKIYALKR